MYSHDKIPDSKNLLFNTDFRSAVSDICGMSFYRIAQVFYFHPNKDISTNIKYTLLIIQIS